MKQSKSISYFVMSRLIDVVFSLAALILLSPVLLSIAILIFIFDGSPIFFKQKRTGLNGDSFYIWKFRTMKPSASQTKSRNEYNWKGGVPDDFVFKTAGSNPNITKIGAFLRKYSLDELPQFVNVLKGDMSIVGPRPEIPEITQHYNAYQAQRLHVKPGITGYAQVNGRSEISHGEKIMYDLYYVKHQSLKLDVIILFKTLYQAIFGKGAF